MLRRGFFAVGVLPLFFTASCGNSELGQTLKGLNSSDPKERVSAVNQLSGMGNEASKVVPVLVKATEDENEEVRLAAVNSFPAFKEKAASATKKLQELAAKDSSAQVRLAAVQSLENLAPNDAETVSTLIEVLKDQDLNVARGAAGSLLRLGPEKRGSAVRPIAELIKRSVQEAVKKKDVSIVCLDLVTGLAQLGPKGADAAPILQSTAQIPGIPETVANLMKATVDAVTGKGPTDISGFMAFPSGNQPGMPSVPTPAP